MTWRRPSAHLQPWGYSSRSPWSSSWETQRSSTSHCTASATTASCSLTPPRRRRRSKEGEGKEWRRTTEDEKHFIAASRPPTPPLKATASFGSPTRPSWQQCSGRRPPQWRPEVGARMEERRLVWRGCSTSWRGVHAGGKQIAKKKKRAAN